MILEPNNTNLEIGESAHIVYDNGFEIYFTRVDETDCEIKYGYGKMTNTETVNIDKVKDQLEKIINIYVKQNGAKRLEFTKSRKQKSEYRSIMELDDLPTKQ
jgi:hypothetical protein